MEKYLGHSSESPTIPRIILHFFFPTVASVEREQGSQETWILIQVTDPSYQGPDPGNSRGKLEYSQNAFGLGW